MSSALAEAFYGIVLSLEPPYALFHLLTNDAAKSFVGDDEMLSRINRTCSHGEMPKVSKQFIGDKLPRALQPHAGRGLQSRQDLFPQRGARGLIERVDAAFADWQAIHKGDYARLYLPCFLLWDRWDKEW